MVVASHPNAHRRPAPRAGWALPPDVSARLDYVMCDAVAEAAGPLAGPLIRVISAGGKRLRPALTLGIAALRGGAAESQGALAAAAAVELLHCASLVHDDLIDGAPTRRGVATLSAQEGRAAAVVGGDLLIAAAGGLAGGVSRDAGLIIVQTLARLCRGEALQDQQRYDASVPPERLMEVTRLKTGSLFQAACVLGAQAPDAGPAFREAVAGFGMDLGICVQLVDDLLDVVSDQELAAKPVGADFASGTLTLPIALAIRDCQELGALLRPGLDPVEHDRAMSLLQNCAGALAETAAMAHAYASRAADRLRSAASGPAAEQLARWPAEYVNRQLRAKVSQQHRWFAAALVSATP